MYKAQNLTGLLTVKQQGATKVPIFPMSPVGKDFPTKSVGKTFPPRSAGKTFPRRSVAIVYFL